MAATKGTTAKSSKARGGAAKAGGARKAAQGAGRERNRRSPAQLLADLKAEREAVAAKMGERLAKLDERIQRVEARYETQIRLAELTEGATLDDLNRQLEEARRQQKLLRMALKAKR